jgi:outer membrane biosynthesis protein TonB
MSVTPGLQPTSTQPLMPSPPEVQEEQVTAVAPAPAPQPAETPATPPVPAPAPAPPVTEDPVKAPLQLPPEPAASVVQFNSEPAPIRSVAAVLYGNRFVGKPTACSLLGASEPSLRTTESASGETGVVWRSHRKGDERSPLSYSDSIPPSSPPHAASSTILYYYFRYRFPQLQIHPACGITTTGSPALSVKSIHAATSLSYKRTKRR